MRYLLTLIGRVLYHNATHAPTRCTITTPYPVYTMERNTDA